MWLKYLEKDINDFHREDYYLAQIATEIRRSYVKRPKSVRLKDMLLKFTSNKKPVSKTERELHNKKSKAFWLSALGFGKKK